MTPERAEAYGRIVRALRAYFRCAPRDEIARIHAASDGKTMTEAFGLLADLVARGGISRELATALVDDVHRCAPAAPAHATIRPPA
jgi:hypothetical protein